MFSTNSNNPVNRLERPLNQEIVFKKGTQATLELRLKQIFIATIIGINVAALVIAYRALVQYCPIKSEPIITSSFLIGALGGVVSLNWPTLGVHNGNLNQFLDPISLIGRVLAYAFFGPTLLIIKALDLTDYAKNVNAIAGELKSESLVFCAEKYFKNISNLERFGILRKQEVNEIKDLYQRYKKIKDDKEELDPQTKNVKLEMDPHNETKKESDAVNLKMDALEKEWKNLQMRLNPAHVKYIKKDNSSWSAFLWRKIGYFLESPGKIRLA